MVYKVLWQTESKRPPSSTLSNPIFAGTSALFPSTLSSNVAVILYGENSLATMAVRQHEIQNQFGVVKIKGVEIEGFEEKPIYRSHVNAGIYVLEPSTLHNLVHGQHCDMPTLFERVRLNGGKAVVYPMHEPWLDVGRPEDLSQARQHQT